MNELLTGYQIGKNTSSFMWEWLEKRREMTAEQRANEPDPLSWEERLDERDRVMASAVNHKLSRVEMAMKWQEMTSADKEAEILEHVKMRCPTATRVSTLYSNNPSIDARVRSITVDSVTVSMPVPHSHYACPGAFGDESHIYRYIEPMVDAIITMVNAK